MTRPEDLYRHLGSTPEGPLPLVVALEGWIEASDVLSQTSRVIAAQADLTPIAEFDIDALCDQRNRRPIMTVLDGVVEGLEWPTIELALGTDQDDRPFLFLHGVEPDLAWRPFSEAVTTIVTAIGVNMMYSLGAYPAPVPHTRPSRISTTASEASLLAGRQFTEGVLRVPVGAHAPIAANLKNCGTHSVGLWAQVPYYLSGNAWPEAACRLLMTIGEVAGLRFDTSAVEAELPEAARHAQSLLDESPGLQDVIEGLETRFDSSDRLRDDATINGDELEQQVQQYLRDLDN